MKCPACGGDAHDWFGDIWCDSCGGVMTQRAGGDFHLLFRHVATVDGTMRLPIVWDESAQHYLFRWPNKVNPRHKEGVSIDEDIPSTPILSTFGTLDVVLTQALAATKPEGEDVPELSVAPTVSSAERSLMGV